MASLLALGTECLTLTSQRPRSYSQSMSGVPQYPNPDQATYRFSYIGAFQRQQANRVGSNTVAGDRC